MNLNEYLKTELYLHLKILLIIVENIIVEKIKAAVLQEDKREKEFKIPCSVKKAQYAAYTL